MNNYLVFAFVVVTLLIHYYLTCGGTRSRKIATTQEEEK